jgi:tripartite ATP-independent transporter DctP family solute receptor
MSDKIINFFLTSSRGGIKKAFTFHTLIKLIREEEKMFKWRKVFMVLGLLSLVITFSSVSLTAEKKWNVRLASYFGSDHAAIIALNKVFKPQVYEKTGGRVTVNVFDNCQLGAEVELTESLRAGTVELAIFGNMLENTLPKMAILQQPFVFRDVNHLLKVVNGPVGDKLLGDFKKVGVIHLSGFSQGAVHLANKVRPIRTLKDCKGLRMRVWEGKSIIDSMKAIGVVPIAMALTETYTALQQGIVDGVPNSILNLKNMGWSDQIKYISKMTMMIFPNYYVANQKWWNSLPADVQKAIREAAVNTANYTIKILGKEETKTEKWFKNTYGTEIISLTDKQKKPFKNACKPVINDFCKRYSWARELFDDIEKVK